MKEEERDQNDGEGGKGYSLENPKGVAAFLANYHHIRTSAYVKSDFDALVMLIDFETAFSEIDITKRQKQAISLVYWEDLTQREAGERLGISQQAVQQMLNAVITKIADNCKTKKQKVDARRGRFK